MGIGLDDHYAELERRFPPNPDGDYERLVIPHGNADDCIHRWFHMKEAYSAQLIPRLLKDLDLVGHEVLHVHDPFIGSGTTAVSALTAPGAQRTTVTASEVNPFLSLVAGAKAGALSADPARRQRLVDEVKAASKVMMKYSPGPAPEPPALAAFGRAEYFPREALATLLKMRAAWDTLPPSLSRSLVGLSLAACVEPSSRLRRDGRALRYEPDKLPVDPRDEFEWRIGQIIEDLANVESNGTATVVEGSALDARTWPARGTVDLICFSPPYPNNIDYTEVYKLEAWFLGLISDSVSFRQRRDMTMRSHPSIVFSERHWPELPGTVTTAVESIAAPLLHAVPDDRYKRQRLRTIKGYLDDAAAVLHQCSRALRPGGYAVYVVGNSRHGAEKQYTIASDILLAAIAAAVGLAVIEVKTARQLYRRGKHAHLRESVVILRKNPND